MSVSPILSYPFLNSEIHEDYSGNSLNLTNIDVALVDDAERGPVASFNGSTSRFFLPSSQVPSQMIGTVPRSYSCWVKRANLSRRSAIHQIGGDGDRERFRCETQTNNTIAMDVAKVNSLGSTVLAADTWYHIGITAGNSVIKAYINGILDITWNIAYNTTLTDFNIGEDMSGPVVAFTGLMSEFRVFGVELTQAEIVTDMNTATSTNPSMLSISPSVFIADITWSEKTEAISYRVNYTGTDGDTGSIVTSDTSGRVSSLNPGIEYTFQVFSFENGSYLQYGESETATTLEDILSNYDQSIFLDDLGRIDLTSIGPEQQGHLDLHMNDLFDTNDNVVQKVNNTEIETSFIQTGETVTISDSTIGYTVPFSQSLGNGQSVTISANAMDVVVSYDETNNEVLVGGQSYSHGDSLILDGKKMTVYIL